MVLGDNLHKISMNLQLPQIPTHPLTWSDFEELLKMETAKTMLVREKFKNRCPIPYREFCEHTLRSECAKYRDECNRVHFKRIMKPYTDLTLGDCSYLNTCHRIEEGCKYVHYELDTQECLKHDLEFELPIPRVAKLYPPQWVCCDVRKFDLKCLGKKFSVIMADPPWDIHMSLPYGTMTDDEMKQMEITKVQEDGFLFLWVTGRAMEVARDCLKAWGYRRVEELVWIKTNQAQRIIRTGRTGHWLNHSKEHCVIAMKGNPKNYNPGLDGDVLVAEVRETSRKPDEIYELIERLSPGTPKLEIFGRMHNTRPGWITLGNQLDGTRLYDRSTRESVSKRYPHIVIQPPEQELEDDL